MQTFTNQKVVVDQSRLVYSGTPPKSTFVSIATNKTCYLRPLNEEESSVNGVQYGRGFMIIFEVDYDIEQGDKFIIEDLDGTPNTYTVRGIAKHDRGGATKYIRAVATLPEAS